MAKNQDLYIDALHVMLFHISDIRLENKSLHYLKIKKTNNEQ